MYSLPTPMMVLLLLLPIPFDLTSSFLSPVQWHYQFSGTLLLLTRLTPLGYRNAIIIIIILVVVVILIPKMTMRMMVIILSDIIIIIIAQDTLLWSLSIYFSSCVCQRSYWEHLPHYFFMINDKNIPPFLPSSTSYFFCWWSCSLIDTIRFSFLYFFLLLLLLIYASKRRRHSNIIVFLWYACCRHCWSIGGSGRVLLLLLPVFSLLLLLLQLLMLSRQIPISFRYLLILCFLLAPGCNISCIVHFYFLWVIFPCVYIVSLIGKHVNVNLSWCHERSKRRI